MIAAIINALRIYRMIIKVEGVGLSGATGIGVGDEHW